MRVIHRSFPSRTDLGLTISLLAKSAQEVNARIDVGRATVCGVLFLSPLLRRTSAALLQARA
jgi:hypothetical protein